MKFYGYYRSSTSYRLRIALELKGLVYEHVPVNLLKAEQSKDVFASRNPYKTVPMLKAKGRDRSQSVAILEWLDEAYPTSPLLPEDVEERYIARELAYAIATELHAPLNMASLRYLSGELGHSQDQVDNWYRHWLKVRLGPIETRLAQMQTEDFLFDRPGFFEAILIPQIYNARRFAFNLEEMPRISRIDQACMLLPAFRRAHPDVQPDNPER